MVGSEVHGFAVDDATWVIRWDAPCCSMTCAESTDGAQRGSGSVRRRMAGRWQAQRAREQPRASSRSGIVEAAGSSKLSGAGERTSCSWQAARMAQDRACGDSITGVSYQQGECHQALVDWDELLVFCPFCGDGKSTATSVTMSVLAADRFEANLPVVDRIRLRDPGC